MIIRKVLICQFQWIKQFLAVIAILFVTAAPTIIVHGFCHAPPISRTAIHARRKYRTLIETTILSLVTGDQYYDVVTTATEQSKEIDELNTDMESVRRYTEDAIIQTCSERGLEALQKLSYLCQERLPFIFPTQAERGSASDSSKADAESFIRKWKQLFPSKDVAAIKNQIQAMEANDWWSTNPDSVDGLPSFHLNLVSNGVPLFAMNEVEGKVGGDDNNDFARGVQDLLQLVHPVIYQNLLPRLQQEWLSSSDASSKLEVSDIFIRRYGRELEDTGIQARQGISAHYDVYSKVTAVVALDNVAVEGTNGLYTTNSATGKNSEDDITISTNHAALRRFIPLREGDAVVHTWDILHGVDVEPGLDRTSLIVWFTEASVLDPAEKGADDKKIVSRQTQVGTSMVSPWLLRHPKMESDDVAQFVLASALSSCVADNEASGDGEEANQQPTEQEYQHQLYIESASSGNSFALTSVGSLVEEGALSHDSLCKVKQIAEEFRPFESLPGPIQKCRGNTDSLTAMRFWLEGAVRGNPLAQKALADELMYRQSSQPDHDPELNALTATLFALAAQQGDEEASDCLDRVVDFELQNTDVRSQEDFLALDVVQVARAATSSLRNIEAG